LFLFYSKHKNWVFVMKLSEKAKQNMHLQRATEKKNKEPAHTIFRMMQHLFLPTKKNRTKAEAHFPPEVAVWWVLQVSIFSST